MTTAEISESAMKDALTHLFSDDKDIEPITTTSGGQPEEIKIERVQSKKEEILASTPDPISPPSELPAPIGEKPENPKPRVSRAELIQIMEGFVELVKNSDDDDFSENELSFAPPRIEKQELFSVADRTAEVAELRTLLVEAQGTIIRLLTDRVDDRARLASLQNEIRLLPDLKAQADRAMAIAFTSDEFKAEFAKVKLEIERIKLAKMRAESNRPWWARLTDWITKKESAPETE